MLEHLGLSDNKRRRIEALVASPLVAKTRLPALELLHAGVCELGDVGATKLLTSKTLPALAHLILDDNSLTKNCSGSRRAANGA